MEVEAKKKALDEAEAIKKALDEFEAGVKTLEEEQDATKAAAGKTTKELLFANEALEKTSSEYACLRKAHAKTLDVVKSLQKQRTTLTSKLESTKEALAAEQ